MSKFKFKYGILEFEIEGEDELVKERSEYIFNTFKQSSIEAVGKIPAQQINDNVDYNEMPMATLPASVLIEQEKIALSPLSVYMNSKNFIKDCDVFLGLAYYLEQSQKKSEWSVKDIEDMFRTAKKQLPKNISQNIKPNFDKGYIDSRSIKGTKTYCITDIGIKYIQDFVNTKEVKSGKSARNVNRATISPEVIEENQKIVRADNYTEEELNIFKTCKSQREFVLWSAYLITKKFGEEYAFTYNNLTALLKKNGISIDDEKVTKVISANKNCFENSKSKYFTLNGVGVREAEKIRTNRNDI